MRNQTFSVKIEFGQNMADTSGSNQKELDTPNANHETSQDKDVEQPFLPNKCRKFGLL